ncbi:hypothetical protein ACLK1Y_02165 [Escherichia coli]
MRRSGKAPKPRYRTGWRAEIGLHEGQPRRRYAFKLLWDDRQQWFSPTGFSAFPPAKLALFAFDGPDAGPQWVTEQVFYQIFPDRFARSPDRAIGRTTSTTIMRPVTTSFCATGMNHLLPKRAARPFTAVTSTVSAKSCPT